MHTENISNTKSTYIFWHLLNLLNWNWTFTNGILKFQLFFFFSKCFDYRSLIILSTFKVAFVPVLVYFSRGPLYNSWSCGFFFFALINVTKRQDYTCWIYLLFDRIQHILGFPKFDRVWELCQLTTKRQVEQLLKLFREVWIPVERKERQYTVASLDTVSEAHFHWSIWLKSATALKHLNQLV